VIGGLIRQASGRVDREGERERGDGDKRREEKREQRGIMPIIVTLHECKCGSMWLCLFFFSFFPWLIVACMHVCACSLHVPFFLSSFSPTFFLSFSSLLSRTQRLRSTTWTDGAERNLDTRLWPTQPIARRQLGIRQ